MMELLWGEQDLLNIKGIDMTISKIESIEKKIHELKKKKHELERKHSESLIKLIHKCGIKDIDEIVFAGALLSIANDMNSKKEDWQKAGEMFLKKQTSKNSAKHQKKAS